MFVMRWIVVVLWCLTMPVGCGQPSLPEVQLTPPPPATERATACGQVSYGSLAVENRVALADLEMKELLVQLEKPPFVTPPNPEGPTLVGIGLHVYEITDVDPATNTFTMEGYVDLVWCDPRERFDPARAGIDTKIFLERDADKELQYIWSPDFYFVNEVEGRNVENEELIRFADGTVEYREKFGVTLATEFDMTAFPFDSQLLEVEIESFAWSSRHLEFQLDTEVVGFSRDFGIPEWSLIGVEEHLEMKREIRDRDAFSELVAEITVQRDPGFYVTKIMLPLGIIVAISWSVFWMIGDTLADRMSVSFTGVLTSVAYQFIVSESLPRHVYNTFLDGFVLLSFVMMVLTIGENIAVNALLLGGRPRAARTLDLASRLFFPTTYFGGLGVLAFAYVW